ncbi:endoribonuclease XendoU [Oesophagostomum dentatum]|uniref:Endoribonuclease XendoU n=1 Tax=Oesophagostomum dentatum TaxID=61180 RepID=A0A0B1S0Y0_OESDE|nr:endoribonuclease XendoU [Oesophagostomum dentatum]
MLVILEIDVIVSENVTVLQQKFNRPLFGNVKTDHATYKKLDELLTFYNPDANEPEIYTPAWESAISSFVDAVMKTNVMKSAQQFLAGKGLASLDDYNFKAELMALWFTPYARGPSTGSSGFEALFAGEVQDGKVIRFANWYRLSQLEKQGLINYQEQKQAVSKTNFVHSVSPICISYKNLQICSK